jgi:asparagine synthase (glutamine-hydrolysing)
MSGIYGIFRYDGAPIDPQLLDRMRAAMAYYGPDGGGCKIDGPVGMGHLLLAVNPEDVFEQQPMRCERGLVACAARLDNREALLEAFGITSSEAPQVSDGQLVNMAFDRWGSEVSSRLAGDWSLAAWDSKQRELLLSRDVYGCGNLYLYPGNGFIAFASNLKALLALPGTVKEPNPLCLAEIMVTWQFHADQTAYKGFRRLMRAHAMTIGSQGDIRSRRYWCSQGRGPLRYRSDEEYEEEFREHYSRALRSCLRSNKPIAAELSGGRDSASVVTMAAPILAAQGRELTAYTSVPHFAPDAEGLPRSRDCRLERSRIRAG